MLGKITPRVDCWANEKSNRRKFVISMRNNNQKVRNFSCEAERTKGKIKVGVIFKTSYGWNDNKNVTILRQFTLLFSPHHIRTITSTKFSRRCDSFYEFVRATPTYPERKLFAGITFFQLRLIDFFPSFPPQPNYLHNLRQYFAYFVLTFPIFHLHAHLIRAASL